jgi:quercetin dioxygenase-like cupin family protein
MQRSEFEAAIRAEGFQEIFEKTGEPNAKATPHTHPFDVRILVLEGQMTVTTGTEPHVCGPGDTFRMESNCEHFESHGPAGSRYVLGRRMAA